MRQSRDFEQMGDKHKHLEEIFAGQRLIPGVPTLARLDGRAFHTLLRGANKPFDSRVVNAMQETAKKLLEDFNADIAYTQSDEITLVWRDLSMFDCKIQKMVSTLASMTTFVFNVNYCSDTSKIATFDCRIWQVKDLETAAENLMWREVDATKNSISMLASHHFTPAQLHGKHSGERLEMLEKEGIRWAELDHWLKKGSYFQKIDMLAPIEKAESIPEKYRPTGPILRSVIIMMYIPPATSISNLADVFFNEVEPLPFKVED